MHKIKREEDAFSETILSERIFMRFIVLIVLMVFLSINTYHKFTNKPISPECSLYKSVIAMEGDGVILKKGKDKESRYISTIWVQEKDGVVKKMICFRRGTRKLYDVVNAGDRISKQKGSLEFIINDKRYMLFDVECNEK